VDRILAIASWGAQVVKSCTPETAEGDGRHIPQHGFECALVLIW
jgi:hypothetical protein